MSIDELNEKICELISSGKTGKELSMAITRLTNMFSGQCAGKFQDIINAIDDVKSVGDFGNIVKARGIAERENKLTR